MLWLKIRSLDSIVQRMAVIAGSSCSVTTPWANVPVTIRASGCRPKMKMKCTPFVLGSKSQWMAEKRLPKILTNGLPAVTIMTCGLIQKFQIESCVPTMGVQICHSMEAKPGKISTCPSRRCIISPWMIAFRTMCIPTGRMHGPIADRVAILKEGLFRLASGTE